VIGYTVVWMVYLRYLSPRWQTIVEFLGHLVWIAVAALIVYQTHTIAECTHHNQIASLPMNLVHVVIPVSFAFMAAEVILNAVTRLCSSGIAGEMAQK
jgi:TRAP-type C4-dicarboxylate transport system permease small subunit